MRPLRRPLIAALLLALAASPLWAAGGKTKPVAEVFGEGKGYELLGTLPVMHEGRIKPVDTLAREEIKQIYGRETIKFFDDEENLVASWSPVAAFFDWSVHPDYWDGRPFIKVEYLPLKQMLLAAWTRDELEKIAGKLKLSKADGEAIGRVLKLDEIDAAAIKPLLTSSTLAPEDRATIAGLVRKLGEGNKFLTPREIRDAQVTVDGQSISFGQWIDKIEQDRASLGESGRLPTLEEKAREVALSVFRYWVIRDRRADASRIVAVLIVPRPSTDMYVDHADVVASKVRSAKETRAPLTLLDRDTVDTLQDFYGKHPEVERGSPEARAEYVKWLKQGSSWLPMAVMLKTDPEELEKAGFPHGKVEAFQAAFRDLERVEKETQGHVDQPTAAALLAAARDLGLADDPGTYPTASAMALETHFNAFGPFFWSPFAYTLGAIVLAISLSIGSARSAVVVALRRTLYLAGVLGFVAGIGLEVYGFSLRVRITGWAPVTNMYETVIWVALVTSVLGLVFELIHRKTFAALAASSVAAVCTALAATAPLLDPTIHGLNPVLQSNLWLTIHVLTIVSSYAAFAGAMGLGCIATVYYLTATYRRSATYLELASPLAIGAPLFLVGVLLREASFGMIDLGPWINDRGFYASIPLTCIGGVLGLLSLIAVAGEFINRMAFLPKNADGLTVNDPAALVGNGTFRREMPNALAPISGGSPAALPLKDPRTAAMQVTAARIKPLSNFIYRQMQIGVLLVAAGTILGGVWADYSWGRFWGWDAKEVWALITLLVYLVPLHGRFAGWVNTFGLVMASVVCFLSVLMAWYGVNFVLGIGLHSYGFGKGGSQGTVGIATLCLLSVAAGTAWRRFLSQKGAPIEA